MSGGPQVKGFQFRLRAPPALVAVAVAVAALACFAMQLSLSARDLAASSRPMGHSSSAHTFRVAGCRGARPGPGLRAAIPDPDSVPGEAPGHPSCNPRARTGVLARPRVPMMSLMSDRYDGSCKSVPLGQPR